MLCCSRRGSVPWETYINIAAASAFVPTDDHSRVELSLITSDTDSHYINANFIKVLLLSWCSAV